MTPAQQNEIIKPLLAWYDAGSEDYHMFVALLKAAATSAYLVGKFDMRERAAVCAWHTGMDAYMKRGGLPVDSRELGAMCTRDIRSLPLEGEGE